MVTMRIAQIVLANASEYERKCQRVDFAALSAEHEVGVVAMGDAAGYDVAHVYARTPYVGTAARKRWPFGKAVDAKVLVSPIGAEDLLPEAVEEAFFGPGVGQTLLSAERATKDRQECPSYTIGTFGPRRKGVRNMVEQTLARLHRFRDDVEWRLFDEVPSPAALAGVDVWVDPVTDPGDFDGFVAEALVVGLPVVAARLPINERRLEKGRTGFLVPPSDPNETTHAILAALFKPEVAEQRLQAARQTLSKFRPRQRLRVLSHMYDTLLTS